MVAVKNACAGIAVIGWVWLMAGCAEVIVPGALAGGGEAYRESRHNNQQNWTGDMLHWFEGNRYPFFKVDMGTALKDFTQPFTCE